MKKVASAIVPIITVNRRASEPLHRQIYEAYRSGIVGHRLRPGQRVPSTRMLATELGISRMPVLNAYAQLLAEGYFESRVGAGTVVCSSLPEQALPRDPRTTRSARLPSGPRPLALRSSVLSGGRLPWSAWGAFGVGQMAFEHFPIRIWSSLIARHSRKWDAATAHYGNQMGLSNLRETIASYLRTSRGVSCEPRQIMIVSGSQQALELSARVLLDTGSRVWVEEPCYRLTRDVLAMTGCRMVPVPVDEEGLDVAAGIRLCRKARVAFVTPSHQYPLGVTMSASRRLQLLEWAQRSGSWIVEDDYDSEYRYDTMPIASLQGLDSDARVLYVGTFSKVLVPSLRLGYVVIPPDLIDRFMAVRRAMDLGPPTFFQSVVADFISEGHFARHIRRMRTIYRERRSALVDSIREELGAELEILGEEAGMHFVALMTKEVSDVEIATRAAEQKLWLWPLSRTYIGRARQGFILGFGSTPAEEIPRSVRRLRNVLHSR